MGPLPNGRTSWLMNEAFIPRKIPTDPFEHTPDIPKSPQKWRDSRIPFHEKEVSNFIKLRFWYVLFGVLVEIFLGSPGISWGLGLGAFPPGVVSCSLPKEQWLFGPWPRKSQKRGGAESCQSRGPSRDRNVVETGEQWKKPPGWLGFFRGWNTTYLYRDL